MGVAGIAGAVSAAVGIASTVYSMTRRPPNMDQGNASEAGVLAQAEMLPWQRRYEAAARQGGEVLQYGFTQSTATEAQRQQMAQRIAALDQQIQHAQTGGRTAGGLPRIDQSQIAQLQAQRSALQSQYQAIPQGGGTVYRDHNGDVVTRQQAVASFHGIGTADVQSRLARQMAQVKLALQQKYGVQFADQARQELEQSDPEGTQARAKLYDLIQQQNNERPDRPVADLLDRQVSQQLASGNRLDPVMRDVLDREVAAAQAARGQDAGADSQQFANPLETGFEGQQRQLAAQQKATGWLSSGATPEDVQYRREQQNLSNLGAFVSGQTPEAQFRNLSGSQQGATPFNPGQPLPQAQNGADQTGLGYATSGYLQNMRYQQSQVNPWMAGLSGLLSAGGAAGRAGWQPLGGGTGGP